MGLKSITRFHRYGRQSSLVRAVCVAFLLALGACGGADDARVASSIPPASAAPDRQAVNLLDLVGYLPADWIRETGSSPMRLLQFRIPGSTGEDAAEFVAFYFGPGQGGSAEANIARWTSQFSGPDGAPIVPAVTRYRAGDLPVTVVELTGSYARGVGMGPVGAVLHDRSLIAVVLESAQGNLFLQLHGPSATVRAARRDYLSFLNGIRHSS